MDPVEPELDAVRAELHKLHVAEYQALMARANSFMSFQVGVWGFMIAMITLVVNQWHGTQPHDGAILWLGAIGVQILLHLASTLLEQQYLLISYVENDLRHAVLATLPHKIAPTGFWRYEAFLTAKRSEVSWWGEWFMAIPAALAVAVALFSAWPSAKANALLAFFNVLLAIALIARTHRRVKLRRTFVPTRATKLPARA